MKKITKKEIDAIRFAIEQINNDYDGADPEPRQRAMEAVDDLHSVLEKLRHEYKLQNNREQKRKAVKYLNLK